MAGNDDLIARLRPDADECPFCGRDPYHYVDNGVGMERVAVVCCELGIALFQHGDEQLIREVELRSEAATVLADRDAQIERLEKSLRMVQNAAKTIASSHGTELEHLRQNYAFDHKLRAEVESLREANSILTDQTDAAEARATTAERERDEARAEVERKDAALSILAEPANWRMGGLCDPNSGAFVGQAIARAALTKGGENGDA